MNAPRAGVYPQSRTALGPVESPRNRDAESFDVLPILTQESLRKMSPRNAYGDRYPFISEMDAFACTNLGQLKVLDPTFSIYGFDSHSAISSTWKWCVWEIILHWTEHLILETRHKSSPSAARTEVP